MLATECPICGGESTCTERWGASFTPAAFTSSVFSARRPPDRLHYRMVTCDVCGLLRANPVASEQLLKRLYSASTLDYAREIDSIRVTYGRALGRLEARSSRCDALLEVGCGSGFLLMLAKQRGWSETRGVEPSADAVSKAPAELAGRIVQDVMRAGLFAPESFDAVCLFQVLDHMPRPVDLLRECFTVLRPGGHVLAFNHNVNALSAKLLGERSPIVDVEHTFLYSRRTMRLVFEKVGFVDASVRVAYNTYSLDYLLQLAPIPSSVKSPIRSSRAARLRATLPLGNLCLIARRPE
jgi:SAM-dependent methyltransferase